MKFATMVRTAIAFGSLSIGVKSSTVESAGLVKMLIDISQRTIRTGNIHLNISPGFVNKVNATAMNTIAAKLIPEEIIGSL
jgi:hypothetical protein